MKDIRNPGLADYNKAQTVKVDESEQAEFGARSSSCFSTVSTKKKEKGKKGKPPGQSNTKKTVGGKSSSKVVMKK